MQLVTADYGNEKMSKTSLGIKSQFELRANQFVLQNNLYADLPPISWHHSCGLEELLHFSSEIQFTHTQAR